MCPTTGARSAITAGAREMCSFTGAMLRSLQKTAPCTPPLGRVHCRSWYDALHHGARAAITAGADVMCPTTGARAAITAGAREMCSFTGAMLRSLQKTAPCTPPLERVHCRSWYDALHHGARAAITAGADVMNSPLAHVLRTLQDLIMCSTTADVLRSPQELVQRAPVMAHVQRLQQELLRSAPPLEQALRSLQELVRRTSPATKALRTTRCPHAYLAPLLTDECRSTVGPRGEEPQNCVFTTVS